MVIYFAQKNVSSKVANFAILLRNGFSDQMPATITFSLHQFRVPKPKPNTPTEYRLLHLGLPRISIVSCFLCSHHTFGSVESSLLWHSTPTNKSCCFLPQPQLIFFWMRTKYNVQTESPVFVAAPKTDWRNICVRQSFSTYQRIRTTMAEKLSGIIFHKFKKGGNYAELIRLFVCVLLFFFCSVRVETLRHKLLALIKTHPKSTSVINLFILFGRFCVGRSRRPDLGLPNFLHKHNICVYLPRSSGGQAARLFYFARIGWRYERKSIYTPVHIHFATKGNM